MDIKQTYREETNLEPYVESKNNEDYFSNKYVKWLEQKLTLTDVVKSLPTKEEVSIKGVSEATSLAGWSYEHKLSDRDEDTYYTGWMNCYEWIKD